MNSEKILDTASDLAQQHQDKNSGHMPREFLVRRDAYKALMSHNNDEDPRLNIWLHANGYGMELCGLPVEVTSDNVASFISLVEQEEPRS